MSSSNCRNIVLLACLTGTCVAYGQRLSYGVKGGVSTFEPASESNDESKHYIVGATIEFQLWHGFAVEGDFLYRRTGFKFDANYLPSLIPLSQFPIARASTSSSFRCWANTIFGTIRNCGPLS